MIDKIIIKYNITHISISSALKNNHPNMYNLSNYLNGNENENTLFYGVYDLNDYNKIINHKGKKIIFWGGNDADTNNLNRLTLMKNIKYAIHIAHTEIIYKNLIKVYENNMIETTYNYKVYEDDKINKMPNKNIILDITIPMYLYNCPQRELATKIVLDNYYKISNLLKIKYNVKLTLTIIGSEKEISKQFIENNCKIEYIYYEFDQKNIRFNGTYPSNSEEYKQGFWKMLGEKFQYSYKCSIEKKPNITLLAGSNDFISLTFFEQIIDFYNKDEKQLYGIGGFNYGNNKTLFTFINDKLKFDKEMTWVTGEYPGREKFKYAAGIIGFNDKLYNDNYVDVMEITNTFDEGIIESSLSAIEGVKQFISKNTYYVNQKTLSESEITKGNSLIDGFRKTNGILNFYEFDDVFKKNFYEEYISLVKDFM